jgi:hypothetical protein
MRGYQLVNTKIIELCGPDAVIIANCVKCNVEFLTVPANRHRKDLRCPFGCRQTRKREMSRNRGRRRYQTPEGRKAKKVQNRRRYIKTPSSHGTLLCTCSVPEFPLDPNLKSQRRPDQVLLTSLKQEHTSHSNSITNTSHEETPPILQPKPPVENQSRWSSEVIVYLCWVVGKLLDHPITQIQMKEWLEKVLWRFSSKRSLKDRGG